MNTDAMKTNQKVLPANGTGNREARPKHWYVIQVRSCCERKVANKIGALEIESFVPTQKEKHQWSDRTKIINRIVIPMIVFAKMTSDDVNMIRDLSFVYALLKEPGKKEYAVIPDKQMNDFRKMLEQHDLKVAFDNDVLSKGIAVRITNGLLSGCEGFVTEVNTNKTKVYLNIASLGCASVLVNASDIEIITGK